MTVCNLGGHTASLYDKQPHNALLSSEWDFHEDILFYFKEVWQEITSSESASRYRSTIPPWCMILKENRRHPLENYVCVDHVSHGSAITSLSMLELGHHESEDFFLFRQGLLGYFQKLAYFSLAVGAKLSCKWNLYFLQVRFCLALVESMFGKCISNRGSRKRFCLLLNEAVFLSGTFIRLKLSPCPLTSW